MHYFILAFSYSFMDAISNLSTLLRVCSLFFYSKHIVAKLKYASEIYSLHGANRNRDTISEYSPSLYRCSAIIPREYSYNVDIGYYADG
jgi:hypothetical protein